MKACTKCGEVKPLDEYSPDRGASDGRGSRCRACLAVGSRERYAANPEVAWTSSYRKRARAFGFTPHIEEFTYADVIETYGNGCAHCPEGEFEQLDHYPVPVALGGHHSLENVKPSCASCNLAEGAAVRTARTEAIAA